MRKLYIASICFYISNQRNYCALQVFPLINNNYYLNLAKVFSSILLCAALFFGFNQLLIEALLSSCIILCIFITNCPHYHSFGNEISMALVIELLFLFLISSLLFNVLIGSFNPKDLRLLICQPFRFHFVLQ